MIDDDRLERALAALPLEEPPPELRARILAATIYHPVPAVALWEVCAVGTFVALAVWSIWGIVAGSIGVPGLVENARGVARFLDHSVFSTTGLSIAVGISATLWIALFWRSNGPRQTISIAGR